MAHAFLFSGPRGVGKTSVARILAKALNCEAGPTPHPDNTCQVCQEITNGSSMDVLEIDGASNRGIDEVRDLREKIKYLPTQGKYKVYIIDEVHMLTKEAFNALLKTLEEPPAHAVFILATTEPHKVPVTILSRCQRYDFRRIPTGMIQEHLAKLAAQEGWHIDPEGLALVARAAEGGLRDAQGFLDQVVTFGGDGVSAAEIARILGVTDREGAFGRPDGHHRPPRPGPPRPHRELYNQGHDLGRFYQDLVLYARHLLLAGLHPEARHLAAVADTEWDELTALARRTPAVHLHNLLSVLLQGEEELKRAPQPRLALEVLLLRADSPGAGPAPDRVAGPAGSPGERLEAGPCGGVCVQPAPGSASRRASVAGCRRPAASPAGGAARPLREAGLDGQWQAFLQFVQEKEGGPLYGKLSQCRLLGQDRTTTCRSPGAALERQRRPPRSPPAGAGPGLFRPRDHPGVRGERRPNPEEKPGARQKPLDMQKLKQQALEVFGGGGWAPREGGTRVKNLSGMMKQAQKLQAKMMEMQAELGNRTVSAQAGGGMVEAVVNGRQELVSLRIDPEVVVADDVEMLQDLILAAINEALNRSREMMAQEMSKLTGGMQIPGLF